jgi:hypothetical protein
MAYQPNKSLSLRGNRDIFLKKEGVNRKHTGKEIENIKIKSIKDKVIQ